MDNSIPAVERALAVLRRLEGAPGGQTATALGELGIPRTTLYRILRILEKAGFLVELPTGNRYVLGPAIRRLAASMPASDDLASRARPTLERLAAELGETVKIVVREGLETVAIAVHTPDQDSRVASRLGARLPLHIGAGQRLLLSRAPREVLVAVLARPLDRRNTGTIVDPSKLERNIAQLRRRDWALGRNEGAPGVGSIAALIHEPGQPARAALVALYVVAGRTRAEVLRMRDRVLAASRLI